MPFLRKCLIALIAIVPLLAATSVGQYERELYLKNPNPSFESGQWGWNSVTAQLSTITRTWEPDANSENDQLLGEKLVRLRGVGGLGHRIFLHPSSRHYVASVQAFRQSTDSASLGGWAGFGITFFDSNGREIGQVSREIFGPGDSNRGYGDGLVLYSVGGVCPLGATNAILWCWNSSQDTEVLVDEFGLYDLYEQTIYNELAEGFGLANEPSRFTGHEFWLPGDSLSDFGIGSTLVAIPAFNTTPAYDAPALLLGNSFAPTIAYQMLRLEPGNYYDLTVRYQIEGTGYPSGAIGVDYYAPDGNLLNSEMRVIPAFTPHPIFGGISLEIKLPEGAQFATLWFYIAPGDARMAAHRISLSRDPFR